MILSSLAGCLLTSSFFWGISGPGKVIASQITPPYPGYQNISGWEVRNEVWHDYTLDEEAQAAGYKIQAVTFSGNILSIGVTQ